MSIYRSSRGRRQLLDRYDDAIGQLPRAVDSRFVDTRHGETHVLLAGPADGEPIVLFHGGNATNPMTLGWYVGLADEYRLIAPDTIGQPGKSAETRVDPQGPGFGEWVADLLDAFDLTRAKMVGTSYGGGILLRTAAFEPARIDRAVLVVPAGFGTGPLGPLMRVGIAAMGYRYLGWERALRSVLRSIVTVDDPDPVVRETIAASLRYFDLERAFPEADAEELRAFDAPVAIYAAGDDPFFPPEAIMPRATERLSSLVRAETLSGEKHILSPAGQTQVTEAIRTFFDT